MPAKSDFDPEQKKALQAAVQRLRARFTQKELATKLKIQQQSVSDLENGKYGPRYVTAKRIAELEGKPLEELVGEVGRQDLPGFLVVAVKEYVNLDACIRYHDIDRWSPWTIAAARAGVFGAADFKPPEWISKLDILEKALERVKKVA